MIRPMTNTNTSSRKITTIDVINAPVDRTNPGGRGSGGSSIGASIGVGTENPLSRGAGGGAVVSLNVNALSVAVGDSVAGAAPSGTGTMISPAHFGQRTTVPALR